MLKNISKKIALLAFAIVLTGCANSDFSHNYLMRGQVVSVKPDNVVVCVGLEDGAKVGQVLNTYRFIMNDDNDEGADFFMQVENGQIRIEEIIDEHFAKVSVLKGDVKKNDMVQLNK
ncbi:MAG: major membrane immunogen (membrane-anchored lipoprotein) [Cognaticolwellia sp.]|jgi:major membrane immunogen (membrane-anchored lipoprotein)|tara:strand:+ start:504 stop:854 length:351 start_codon:yes stop_codon:yes gene_type:complete